MTEISIGAPEAFASRLQRDFFLSFRFSQGQTELQGKLFDLLAIKYADELGDSSPDTFHQALRMPAWAEAAKVRPLKGAHRPLLTDGYSTAQNERARFSRRLHSVLVMGERYDTYPVQEAALERIVTQDVWWCGGRQERGYGPDPRISYLREFVIRSEWPGSPTFDAVFTDMRRTFIEGARPKGAAALGSQAVYLARAWEGHHPGQRFWLEAA